jgi:hypothetical protein
VAHDDDRRVANSSARQESSALHAAGVREGRLVADVANRLFVAIEHRRTNLTTVAIVFPTDDGRPVAAVGRRLQIGAFSAHQSAAHREEFSVSCSARYLAGLRIPSAECGTRVL